MIKRLIILLSVAVGGLGILMLFTYDNHQARLDFFYGNTTFL